MSSEVLGARTFIKITEDTGPFLVPTSETWNLNDLTMESALSLQAMKDAQEAHLKRARTVWVVRNKREVKDLSSLKTPITRWQQDHERDFNEFCDSLSNIQKENFEHMSTRFKLAVLDVFSSFFVDGDLRGLKDSQIPDTINDSIHDSPGYFEKVLRADHIANWVSRSSPHIIEHICRFYRLWEKFRQHFANNLAKSGNVDMLDSMTKHLSYSGDDELNKENTVTRTIGSASSVLNSDLEIKDEYRAQTKVPNSRFDKLKVTLMEMKSKSNLEYVTAQDDEDRFAKIAARLTKNHEIPKIEDSAELSALLEAGTDELEDLSEDNITFD